MDKAALIGKVVLWSTIIVSVILCLFVITTIQTNDNPGDRAEMWISVSIIWATTLCGVGCVLAIFFSIVQLIRNKRNTKKSILYILAFLGVLLISFLLSSNEIPQFFGVEKFVDNGSLTPATSKLIGAGLISVYLLASIALVLLVGFAVRNSLKRK